MLLLLHWRQATQTRELDMITLRTHAPLLYMTWLPVTLYNLQLDEVPGVEFKNSLYAFGQSEKRQWVEGIIMILIIVFTAIRPSISSLLKSATAYFITKCDGLFLKSACFFSTKCDKCYYYVRQVYYKLKCDDYYPLLFTRLFFFCLRIPPRRVHASQTD